jgi:hypothetical protein
MEGQKVPFVIGTATLEKLGVAMFSKRFTVEDVEVTINRAIETMLNGDKPKLTRKAAPKTGAMDFPPADTAVPKEERVQAGKGDSWIGKANKMLEEMGRPLRVVNDFKGRIEKRDHHDATLAVYKRWLATQADKKVED